MANDVFVLVLGIGFALLFLWGFRALPHEEWQILASVPRERAGDDDWRGLNLTYYGLLTASATGVSTATLFALLGAVGVPVAGSALVAAGVLGACVPAAKIVARMVERKSATFTVGGASFLGMLIAPCVLWLTNAVIGARLGVQVPVSAALAAIVVAYALGEGMGRLACISFGCCYGQAVARSHPFYRTLFATLHFTFTGRSKKAVYEGGLEREPVIPIQAITAVLYVTSGLGGMWLFLEGAFPAAFLLVALVTHLWRAFSETLRADYRGPGRISAYQIMAAVGALYAVAVFAFLPPPGAGRPDILLGLGILWSPWLILLLQGLWIAIFLFTGRSVVTGATISIYVVKGRI
jgi:hypothetical protein